MTPPFLTGTAGDKQTFLAWTAVAGAVKYRVRRNGSQINLVTVTDYRDGNVVNGTEYEYMITAVDASNGTAKSNVIKLTPKAPTTIVGYGRGVTGGSGGVVTIINADA